MGLALAITSLVPAEGDTKAVVCGLSEQGRQKGTSGASLFLWPVCFRPGFLKTSTCRELASCIDECSWMVLRVCLAKVV